MTNALGFYLGLLVFLLSPTTSIYVASLSSIIPPIIVFLYNHLDKDSVIETLSSIMTLVLIAVVVMYTKPFLRKSHDIVTASPVQLSDCFTVDVAVTYTYMFTFEETHNYKECLELSGVVNELK